MERTSGNPLVGERDVQGLFRMMAWQWSRTATDSRYEEGMTLL